jgi:Arc-like DNA binding domain
MVRKPTELRPLMVRIPESLRRKLEREAAKQDRSMNAEIIHRLDQSFLIPPLEIATANATAVLEKLTIVSSAATGGAMGAKADQHGATDERGNALVKENRR